MKWGNKYTAEHVNRLYKMVQKNTSVPFSFYCLTEDATDIECNTIPLDQSLGLDKWWWKICIFKDNLVKGDVNLFFDLDVVIQNNIDSLFNIDKLTIIDFSLKEVETALPINSSIIGWRNNTTQWIYNKFFESKRFYLNNYTGLDTFLLLDVSDFDGWPDDVYYSRSKGDYVNPPNDGKIHIPNMGSMGLHYYPDKKVCIFNQTYQPEFYKGFEKYFL